MRHIVASVLIAGCLSLPVLASQGASGTAAGQRPRACDVLTKELALKVATAEDKRVETFEPFEDELGPNKPPSCGRGPIALILNPFANPAQLRTTMVKPWEPVPGIGEAAFYRADRNNGNLYVFNGARNFAIEITIGRGDTQEVVKAKAIAVAKEVAAKLR